MTDRQREAIEALKEMDCVTVGPELIAQAMGVSPGVLRKHVRDGDYLISEFDVCGSRIRFFRKDFLQKIHEIPPDPPEKDEPSVEEQILITMRDIRDVLICMMSPGQAFAYSIRKEEAAGAPTPTD